MSISILDKFPPPNLDKALLHALNTQAFLQSNPSMGMGYRISMILPLEYKKNRWVIEAFSEIYVDKKPRRKSLGYESKDFKSNTGVNISKVMGKTRRGKDRLMGTFMSPEEFEKYLKTPEARVMLHRFFQELKEQIQPDEETLEKYTAMYSERARGDKKFLARPRIN